ncbi:MAG: TSUP family transporter [Deltaproteobacteria bacterium]|nr:TSUP family transporter [Deltaproteobacteria bacterium]
MNGLLYLLIGTLAGICGGFFGIGGAVVIIPLLIYVAQFPQHLAQGTSVAALLLPIGALAAWRYWQAGHVDLRAALLIAGGFFVGGWGGAVLAELVSGALLRKAFGGLLLVVGLKLILGR